MQPMFLLGVWKEFDELAEAALAQPAARTRTAPSRSAFTGASYFAPRRGVTRPGDLALPLPGDSESTLAAFRAGKPAQTSRNLSFEGGPLPADQSRDMTNAMWEVLG